MILFSGEGCLPLDGSFAVRCSIHILPVKNQYKLVMPSKAQLKQSKCLISTKTDNFHNESVFDSHSEKALELLFTSHCQEETHDKLQHMSCICI